MHYGGERKRNKVTSTDGDAVTGRGAPRPRREPVRGGLATRDATRRAAAAAGWRTAARTTVFVLAFHDRLIDRCAVLYTCNQESVQPSRLCHAARASRGHRRHTKHNSRVHHRDPYVGTVAHDIARHASRMAIWGACAHTVTSPHMRLRTRPSPTAHTASHIMLIITGTKR